MGGFENFFQAVAIDDIAADVRAVWNDAVAAQAWRGPPVWVHGDLHPANVVGSDGTISGIIDFGDMFAGDPAWELAAMRSLFLMLMGQNGDRGLPGGKPHWGPAGRAALDRVLKGV
jgi:aminoglycoside phosphotransferase (APT) family kinase protein